MGNASQINRSRNIVRVERRSDLNESNLGEVYYNFKTGTSNAVKSCTHIEDINEETYRSVFSFVEYYIFNHFLCEKHTNLTTFQIFWGHKIFIMF